MNLIDFVCIVATNGIGEMKHQVVFEELLRGRGRIIREKEKRNKEKKKIKRKEIKGRIFVIETRAARETSKLVTMGYDS